MRTPRAGRSRGQILPLFAISLVALIAMGALLFDGAQALTVRRRLQDAADAASLAGANLIQTGSIRGCSATAGPPPGAPRAEVVTAAKASVAANLPWYPQANVTVTCPSGWGDYAVKVDLATTSPTYLGGVIGQRNMGVGASGTAFNGQLTSIKDSVVMLDPSNPSWTKGNGCPSVLFSGGPTVQFDGSLQVDSACAIGFGGALGTNGTAATLTFDASSGSIARLVGGYSPSAMTITPTPLTGQPSVKDPLLGLPAIDTTGMTVHGSKTTLNGGTTVLTPGVYTGGIQLKNKSIGLLTPGVYYLNGGGLDVGAQASVFSVASGVASSSVATWNTDCPQATCGVLIYNTGTTASLSPISVGAGATVELRPYQPTVGPAVPSGNEYLNLLVWQAAAPVPSSSYQQPDVTLNGGGTVNVRGTIYAPSAKVFMTGSSGGSGGTSVDLTLQFIAWDLQIQGNASFHFFYQSNAFAQPTDYGLIE